MKLTIGQIEQACGGRLVLQDRKTEIENGEAGHKKVLKSVGRDSLVSSVVLDSRQAAKQGVFVAAPGQRVDGHKFIGQVFAAGASLVITEKTPGQVQEEHGIAPALWGNYLLVKDSFQALKDIAESYRQSLQIPIVGITGSVGKTSTKEFIAGVLSQKRRVLKTEGNFNNEIGVPLTLLRIREEHDAAVVEMGISDFGEMRRLSKMVRPNICVFTNIGQCHLENLKTRDGILQAKTEMLEYMAPGGEVCLYGGDDKLAAITRVKGRNTHFFGLGENPREEVYADGIEDKGLLGSDALLYMTAGQGKESFPIHVPLPGIHMVVNAAAAACVGRLLGLNGEEIAEGIGKVKAVGGRSNLIQLEHYTLIDDCYNANPVSMKAALDLLTRADTEKAAILGDMFELGENADALHAEVGAYAARAGIDRIYCVGEKARHMYEAAKKEASEKQRLLYFADKEALVAALSEDATASAAEKLLPERGTVLLKASHGMEFTDIVRMLSCS